MAQPNFIVFLTDDQGYGDLSCMGATDFCTPHLDDLAASGARCTNWYANSPVCSPSRAALLTGRYPGHAGVRAILAGHRTATGLPPHVPTLPRALKALGYQTAIFGKWHLGVSEGYRPHNHGFDQWFGFLSGCEDYYSHIFYHGGDGKNPVHDLWENNREIYDNGRYLTEIITERSVAYLRTATRHEDPFFLYVPFNAPHYPMHAPQQYMDRFSDLPPDRRIMAAMISAVDDGVGAILAELERQGQRENTCIFFQSDNGPSRETRNWLDGREDPYYGGTTGKLKGHKYSLFEGGIRVPGIISWPARIPAGQVIDAPLAAMDIFPTFFNAAGGDATAYDLDGMDILPVITDGQQTPHTDIFWEMGDQTAVRHGAWKLVLNGHLVEGVPADDAVHLANVVEDMAEARNVREAYPDVTAELTATAQAWRADLEARWTREYAALPLEVTAHHQPAH